MRKNGRKKTILGGKSGLKGVPGGPNELQVGTPGDFDLAVLILRVLEAWELGNRGLYRKYRAYKKSSKFQNFILVPGVRKNDFYDFSGIFLRKNGPEIWESRVRRPG